MFEQVSRQGEHIKNHKTHIVVNERYEIEHIPYPLKPPSSSNTRVWGYKRHILRTQEIEPLQRLESTETKRIWHHEGETRVAQSFLGTRIVWPTKASLAPFRASLSYRPDKEHKQPGRVQCMIVTFDPPLDPNNTYTLVRYSETHSSAEGRERYVEHVPEANGNHSFRRSISPKAEGQVKRTSLQISFPLWYRLEQPKFEGQRFPFALAFEQNSKKFPRDRAASINQEETERIQRSFRHISLLNRQTMYLDVPEAKEGIVYSLYWRSHPSEILDGLYPGELDLPEEDE